jgi:hypothetical protein
MCSCIGAALSNGGTPSNGNTVGAVVGTATAGQLQQSQQQATASPTLAPTATATPKPKPTATPKPKPTATPKPKPTCAYNAVNGNPWCYNFSRCHTISNPPSSFCQYFNCIPSFWDNTNGYVEECLDGTYSHSGGQSGSCSRHGGNRRPLLKP